MEFAVCVKESKTKEEKPKEDPKRPTRIEKLFSVSEIRPHLFLAGYGALNTPKFHELGITHAVDATNLPKPKRIEGIEYLDVKVDDAEFYPIKKYFQQTSDFIKQAKDKVTLKTRLYNQFLF